MGKALRILQQASDASIKQLKEIELSDYGISFTGHPEDHPVASTVMQLEGFTQGTVWKDFRYMIDERLELTMTELLNCVDQVDFIRAQQEIQTLLFVREIPTRLLLEHKVNVDLKEEEENG